MIPYDILKELVVSKIRFAYESYNHKKAVEELEELDKKNSVVKNQFQFQLAKNCFDIPAEIKKNHVVWRKGRIRSIEFSKNSEMWRFKVGNRYFKTFVLTDFGVTVKPVLFKSDDKYDLIGQGLAIEETMK
jgi:hypothetical protein